MRAPHLLYRRAQRLLAALAVLWLAPRAVAWGRVFVDGSAPSRSVGTTASGRLEHGHPLPPSGPGYEIYSYLGASLGRQYVHGAVRDLLREAFAARAAAEPGRCFVVGETGHRKGGRFWPHRSHANGMSVDIFQPVLDAEGRLAQVGTWPWQKFGYGLEFDATGHLGALSIDFEGLAALLTELGTRANPHGLRIERIIIAPEYLPLLRATRSGRALGPLSRVILHTPVWWRHDEHIHIDFATLK